MTVPAFPLHCWFMFPCTHFWSCGMLLHVVDSCHNVTCKCCPKIHQWSETELTSHGLILGCVMPLECMLLGQKIQNLAVTGTSKQFQATMPFFHLALIFLPFALGHPHHGSPTNLHCRHRAKETKMTPPPDDTTAAPQETVAPCIECGDGNPFSKKVAGCPCFNLETITSKIDPDTAKYCNFYAGDDPSFLYQYAHWFFHFIACHFRKSTNIYLSIYNDIEPGYRKILPVFDGLLH